MTGHSVLEEQNLLVCTSQIIKIKVYNSVRS